MWSMSRLIPFNDREVPATEELGWCGVELVEGGSRGGVVQASRSVGVRFAVV